MMAGAAMLLRWRLQEQMLDDATRGGRGGRREASASLRIFKKKMAEIDEADAGVNEDSPPPTPTPV